MARSLKKGPSADHHLLAKLKNERTREKKQVIQNLVSSFNNLPNIHGTYFLRI